jgi:hypothetical protein
MTMPCGVGVGAGVGACVLAIVLVDTAGAEVADAFTVGVMADSADAGGVVDGIAMGLGALAGSAARPRVIASAITPPASVPITKTATMRLHTGMVIADFLGTEPAS